MSTGTPITAAQVARMKELAGAGLSSHQIAASMGVGYVTVYRYVGSQKDRLPVETVNRIVEMRERGDSNSVIVDTLGVTSRAVDYHCLLMGVVSRHYVARSRAPASGGYTEADDTVIQRMSAEGASYAAMGRAVGRAPSSVSARLCTLARRDAFVEEFA